MIPGSWDDAVGVPVVSELPPKALRSQGPGVLFKKKVVAGWGRPVRSVLLFLNSQVVEAAGNVPEKRVGGRSPQTVALAKVAGGAFRSGNGSSRVRRGALSRRVAGWSS